MKPQVPPKVNPFDKHINRIKHQVVGRKLGKNEKGKPVASRHKAFQKRKETLLKEYMKRNKVGFEIDDRIRESQGGLHARKAMLLDNVHLGGETVLTHGGIGINDIKNLNDNPMKEIDDEPELFKLADYIEAAHFGGGLDGKPISPDEFLREVNDDKKRRQIEREENNTLIKELDKDWSSVQNLMRRNVKRVEESGVVDSYDRALADLMFGGSRSRVTRPETTIEQPRPKVEAINPNSAIEHTINKLVATFDDKEAISFVKEMLSIELKRVNTSVLNKLSAIIYAEYKKPTVQALGLSLFAVCFKAVEFFAVHNLIEYLRNIKCDSILKVKERLFICQLLLFDVISFVPEVVTALQSLLVLFVDDDLRRTTFLPIHDLAKMPNANFLVINEFVQFDLPILNLKTVFDEKMSSSMNKQFILNETLNLIELAAEKYKKFDSFKEIFKPIKHVLTRLKDTILGGELVELMTKIINLENKLDKRNVICIRNEKGYAQPGFSFQNQIHVKTQFRT